MDSSSSSSVPPLSPWKQPKEVMQLYRLKRKKDALKARMENVKPSQSIPSSLEQTSKRRNPFSKNSDNKRARVEKNISDFFDDSTGISLFKLVNNSKNETQNYSKIEESSQQLLPNITQTLTDLIKKSDESKKLNGYDYIPIDWCLKTKLRVISKNPFKWSSKIKSSEEASGITSFVRCLNKETVQQLDTTINAQLYQCCLYWQHPVLPWLQLFPRSSKTSKMNSSNMIINNPEIQKSLHNQWIDSFCSLFQLLRAKHCPFFYLLANTFTVVFKAAGINGFNEIQAIVTPTTRGFRQMLKQAEIDFSMPLKKSRRSDGDSGNETYESTTDVSNTGDSLLNGNSPKYEDDEEDENKWLASLGVEASDIKKIHLQQPRTKLHRDLSIDNTEESLILLQGLEVQQFFNFLMNSKSVIVLTGPLAGIPPTLLSPVAFHGATLQSLKMKQNLVKIDLIDYSSLEISGPILPHIVHNLVELLDSNDDNEFTISFTNLSSTKTLSKIKKQNEDNDKTLSNPFVRANFADCGLSKNLLKLFCSSDPNFVQTYDSLKFFGTQRLFTWS